MGVDMGQLAKACKRMGSISVAATGQTLPQGGAGGFGPYQVMLLSGVASDPASGPLNSIGATVAGNAISNLPPGEYRFIVEANFQSPNSGLRKVVEFDLRKNGASIQFRRGGNYIRRGSNANEAGDSAGALATIESTADQIQVFVRRSAGTTNVNLESSTRLIAFRIA